MDPSRAPFESMGDYMSNKRAKIDRQFAVIRPVSDLLKGVCVYVNGSTNPTCRELWKMVRMHGGEFQHTMVGDCVSAIRITDSWLCSIRL